MAGGISRVKSGGTPDSECRGDTALARGLGVGRWRDDGSSDVPVVVVVVDDGDDDAGVSGIARCDGGR